MQERFKGPRVAPQIRCTVDLGNPASATAVKQNIESMISDIRVRTAVETYLTKIGVLVGRAEPAGWFNWIQEDPGTTTPDTYFAARCFDPPPADAIDDGYQAWNYLVLAEIQSRSTNRWLAIGVEFLHDSKIAPPEASRPNAKDAT